MSFAIPIDVVMNVSEQLKKTGKVSRGWLGVQLQEVSVALTQLLAMERTRGAMVSEVFSDSPAERAGLMVGDVILAIAGQTIETAMELPPKIGILMAGDTTALEIIRKGETKTLQVQVGLLPETTLLKAENFAIITARLGITVDNFLEEGKNSSRGVLIRTVNTEAALTAGLRQGDIILGMNDTLIRDVADLTQKLSDMMQNTRISVLIQRNKERFFLPLTVL
jgi:serine protease Do